MGFIQSGELLMSIFVTYIIENMRRCVFSHVGTHHVQGFNSRVYATYTTKSAKNRGAPRRSTLFSKSWQCIFISSMALTYGRPHEPATAWYDQDSAIFPLASQNDVGLLFIILHPAKYRIGKKAHRIDCMCDNEVVEAG